MLKPSSNHKILAIAQTDKQKAFEMAFHEFWETLFRQAYRKVQSVDIAKDLTQEVFITLWDKLENLNEEDKLQAYLFAILRNKTLQLFEKDEVRLRYAMNHSHSDEKFAPSSHHLLLGKEVLSIISDEVARMPPRMKEIYTLKKDNYFSIKDIAEKLSLSEQTVKNQLHRASQRLRARLKDYDPSLMAIPVILLSPLFA